MVNHADPLVTAGLASVPSLRGTRVVLTAAQAHRAQFKEIEEAIVGKIYRQVMRRGRSFSPQGRCCLYLPAR